MSYATMLWNSTLHNETTGRRRGNREEMNRERTAGTARRREGNTGGGIWEEMGMKGEEMERGD